MPPSTLGRMMKSVGVPVFLCVSGSVKIRVGLCKSSVINMAGIPPSLLSVAKPCGQAPKKSPFPRINISPVSVEKNGTKEN